MDIGTVMGIIVFLGMVIASIWIAEGPAGFKPFANPEAALIVMGGTFCARSEEHTSELQSQR